MRRIKSISFDLSDDFERELLNHADKNGKFSRYIKRLIQRDKEGVIINHEPEIITDDENEAIESFF